MTGLVRKRAAPQKRATAATGSWAGMVDKALGERLDWVKAARRDVSASMSELQNLQAGERGDRAVQYRQKDHWAFLDLIAMAKANQNASFAIMKQIAARLDALEAAAAKAVPGLTYRGVFVDGQPYEAGDVITAGGSMWHCNEPTGERPGEGAKAWTLCVKRGRDGKDMTRGQG